MPAAADACGATWAARTAAAGAALLGLAGGLAATQDGAAAACPDVRAPAALPQARYDVAYVSPGAIFMPQAAAPVHAAAPMTADDPVIVDCRRPGSPGPCMCSLATVETFLPAPDLRALLVDWRRAGQLSAGELRRLLAGVDAGCAGVAP